MATLSLIVILVLGLIIAIAIGVTTKRWAKSGYFLSALIFLIAFFISMSYSSGGEPATSLGNILALFALGFLVMSLSLLLPHKK